MEKLVYLDAAGMLASAANRLLLQSSMPSERQILTWDRLLVPVSRLIDPIFAGRVGKSVLGIWRKAVIQRCLSATAESRRRSSCQWPQCCWRCTASGW